MSNPFEKYFQATERQHDKINRMTPNWEVPASSPFVPFDTSLDARYSELNKPYTPDPTLKSAGDLLVDAAASALKIPTIVGGVAVGAADLALSAASKPLEGYQRIGNWAAPDLIPEPVNVGIGYIAKGLHDTIGYDPERAKRAIDDAMFSDARKIQEKEYQSGYTAAEDKAFQDSWVNNYQVQLANLQKAGATEQQLKDFSAGFDKEFQQAAIERADKYQTSWDKPLSENINIIRHGFDNLLENPSLALGGAIESGGYLLPSMLVSRGVMALEKAANIAKIGKVAAAEMAGKSIGELAITRSPFLAAGVGEGSVSGLTVLEQMRSQTPDGIAGGKELLGALGVAASTGLLGAGFGKAASKLGIGDIDAAGLGRAASQVAAMKLPALVKPVGAVAQEGAEEFAQTFGESIIPNVTMGKDPLEGLGQELPLGTMAGAIMGAGMNAPSLVTGGFSDISSGLGKVKGAVSDATSLKSFETLSNPEHKNYNPAQAFNLQLKNLESNDETVRTQAQANVSKVEADLNTARGTVDKQINNIKTALKAMPPVAQMTDAQHLEVAALRKEYDSLQAKSEQLTEHLIGFLDAQVMAQEHRDAKQGTQFTEEQAKADIVTLTQPKPSQTVADIAGTQYPVEVIGEPVTHEDGTQYSPVRYTDPTTGQATDTYVPHDSVTRIEDPTTPEQSATQQAALDRVTRHFSKYSSDDLDLLASSPVFNETQRNSLRQLSKSKRELAAVQDPSQVFDNILNGYTGKTIQESHRGLNQYTDMVNTAVATKNEQLATLALDGLGAFTDDHTAKRDTINEAFGLVQNGTYKEIHALRTQEGTWGLVPFTAEEVKAGKNAAGANYLSKEALNEVGGFNVHINSDKPVGGRTVGSITQINNETQLIQDRFNALSGVAESFVGVAPKPVDTSAAPTVDTPIVTEPLNDTDTEVKNKILSEYSIDELVHGGRTKTQQDAIKAQDLEAMKKAYNLLKAEKQVKLLEDTNKKIEAELAVKRELLRKTKETHVGDVVTISNDEQGGEYKAKILAITKSKTAALLKVKVKSGKEYTLSVDQYGNTKTGSIENFVFEAEAPETRSQLFEDIKNLKAQIQEVKDTSDYYVDYFKEGSNTPVITEPSDTTAPVVTPAPEAPVQSEVPVTPATPTETKTPEPITPTPSQDTPAVTDLTNEVKEYGYLGELLADEDVEKVVKDVIEKVLEDKADKSNKGRLTSYTRFVGFFISHGFIEYFTKQAKNDPSIIKLTKDFNKLRDLARMPKHLKVLEDYVDSQNNDDLRAYLNKHPELKSIFSELKVKNPAKGTRGLALDVIGDLTRVQNLLTTELGKLVQLVGLMYIQAAFTKGQQYLIDTNYADLKEVLHPFTLGLLSTNHLGQLQKNRVVGDVSVGTRKLITPTELAFLGKVDGIPVGELPKEDFETVKALVQNAVNAAFNSYEVVNYPRDEAKISSDIVHNAIVEHLPKEGFELETFTPEQVIGGAVPQRFIWESSKQDTPAVTEPSNQAATESKQLAEVLTTQQSKASDVLTELKDSDSGRLSTEYKAYLDTLIEQVVKVFPDTLVQFVKDVSEIPKKYGIIDFHFGKQGTLKGEKFVFIKQAEKSELSDRHETTAHEFIHVATSNYIENYPKGTQSKTVWDLLRIVKAHVNSATDKNAYGIRGLNHILKMPSLYRQAKELLAYGLTHPEIVAELKKIPYTWTSANKGIGAIAASLLETGEPTNVYEALVAAYGNILGIEESRIESTRNSNAPEVTEGLPVRARDTSESAGQPRPDVSPNDSRGGGSNTSTESQQTSTQNQVASSAEAETIYEKLGSKTATGNVQIKPEFQGKVILAHAGTGKSFATKSNPDLIDGDVLYYQATNTIVDKYNEANNESVPNIENVTGTRGVFEAWGEYDKSNPERQAEAVRRRNEIYAEYAKQARALADAGKTVLSSSIREELIAVADMVVIQDDAAFIGKNLTSAERVNQNSETDLVKIQGKIDKAKNAASKNPNLKAYTLEKGEYISDLIFEEPAIPAELTGENAKVTVLQGVTDEVALEERKKPFNLRNILKGYFTQSATKEGATGANPLVTVKNFLKGLGKLTQVSEWVNDRRKPTKKQLQQVEHFKTFQAEFAKALDTVFNTKVAGSETQYGVISNNENLVGYMNIGNSKDGRQLDENVITALALSAYSYLIKQGNKVMNTNEELEALFRLKKGVRAPLEIEQMFRFAGQEMPIVVKALGTDAAKALGLKVREDQDPTLQDRLNTSLGILAMEAMAEAGFIVIDTLEGKPLEYFLTAIKKVRESKAHTIEDEYDFETDIDAETQITKFTMVRPNAKLEHAGKSVFEDVLEKRVFNGKEIEVFTINKPQLVDGLPTLNSPLVNELIEANKDTKGFLSYLFGVDVGYTQPSMEAPEKFTQREIHGTDASVPSAQAELLTEAQKHSFTMRTNTVAVLAKLKEMDANSQFLKELLGIWVDDHVLSRTHVTQRDSLQAKAQNDWTALLNGLEWADATLDEQGQYREFYDTQFVAQNQRQHFNSRMFNAQSSQIHRAMAALTGFSTTIDLSQNEQGIVKDEALLNLFYQAVGEGLEGLDDYLKADILSKAEAGLHQFFTVDKVYGDYYVPALKAFLETTDSKAAVSAMVDLIQGKTITDVNQKAIAAFVDKGGMGVQSLQSLIALAELAIAQANGTTFTTTIGFGSDGVNHGVSAANMLTGVISKDMRQQTGIFPIAEKGQDQISNMQEVYKRKITDYYVDFGKVMSGKLRDLVDSFVGGKANPFVQGMTALFPKFEVLDDTGELSNLLDMRKIAKIWAIPFNYSAGKAALQRALARGFLAGIYGNMNKLANEALDIIDAKNEKGVTAEQLKALDLKLATVELKTKTLEDNLNKVLGKYGMSVTLPAPQLLNEEAEGKLSADRENTLMQAAIDLHGEAAWQATEEFAKEYLQVRNVYTEAEKASFTLFDLVRTQLVEEKKASRKFNNVNAKVWVKGKTVQYTAEELNAQEAEYFDLTTVEMAEIDAVLAAMRPMFNTALSIPSESTNDASNTTNPSGVSVRKHKMQREPASGLRAVRTFYGKPRAVDRNIGLTKVVEENAGVASSANAIQSMDAYVATKIQGFMNALDVHDAAVFGLKDFLKGVKKQNEEHLRALTNYQLGLEHAKMLVKVYQGYKAFMATQEEALKTAEGKVKENIQSIINQATKEMDKLLKGEVIHKKGSPLKIDGKVVSKGGLIPKLQAAGIVIDDNARIETAIGMFIDYAINQDVKKLGMLKDTFGIHQFAGEGGMHKLTKADKASIEKQETLVKKAKEDLQAELKDKAAPMNTTEAVKPMTELAKFLRKAKGAVIDITSLIEHLTNNTDINDLKTRAAQLEVLKAITPLIDKTTKVIYSDGDYDGYGYYDEGTNTLHINSAKEAEGGVRSTLAVHELLHAALSRRIKTLRTAIKNNSGEHPEAVAALKRLDALRVSLVTPAGMKMLELKAELGIEDFVQFYTDQDALIASLKEQVATSLGELQQFNKDKAKPDVLAAKAKEWSSLKTELANAQATLAKADQYLKLRKLLKAKVLSQHTRKDGSISKFTQLDLVNQLENTDEFISHGLTESRLRQVLSKKTVVTAFRSFVKLVGQLLGFSSNQVNALEAFASDTAALLETIGSVTPAITPNNGERLFSTQSAEDLVNGQSTLDIMTALPHSNTGSFNQQLDRLITDEIGQLYNQDEAAKARIDELQTFAASDALNAGFTLSRKEQYVQQALQYAVAAYMKLHAGGANVGQLNRVYHAAKVKISPTGKDFYEGDWATATQQEKDAAKAKYDFMFDSSRDLDYMSRFVSMALASEEVSKILDIALPLNKPETQDKTWFEKVSDWASYVMAWLTNKYVRLNPTLGASHQLSQLMENLVKLDISNRQEAVSFHQKAWNSIGIITTPLNAAWKETRGFLISDNVLKNSRFLPLRALGAAITLRSEAAAKAIPKLIIDMRNNQLPHTKLGEAANILMEAASAGSMRNAFDVLTRQTNLNAKNRQDIVDNVKKAVMSWFKTALSKAQHKAIAYGLLRTDAQALLENYSVEDIVDMVLHEGKLNAEIAKLKKEIAKNPNGNDMLNAAEQLGYYMVTRIGGEGLVKSALGIAIGLGTQYQSSVEQADAKLVQQLDMLASMIAMTYVSNSEKGTLAALYKTDKEGIHATITLHNGLVTQATGLFQDNPLNKVKGWMPEITNPFREIKVAESMVEREQMEAEGWIFIDEVKRDKHDKGDAKYLMKHNDIGYQRYVSGAVDLLNPSRSGTEAIDRTNPKYLGITQARYQNAARRAAIPNGSFDPSKQPRGLITAYDTNGVALAYNYEMDNETRDEHLDRNHNIGDLLGTFGGKNYYTPIKTEQNSAVAQVLFEDYRDNYSQNPNAYLKLSHKSTDPKVVEMWRMLPQDFKDQATALYGKGNPIIIRNEAFNFAFGFKKFSVVSYAFDTKAADRNKFQSGFVGFAEATSKFKSGVMGTFGGTNRSTAQADFAKAEHVVQEIVKAIKDFIVIRSGTTMFWNIFANVLMLMAQGINPVTIIKDWVFAVTNVRAYQKLNSQLIQAQADLVAGKEPTALKQKIGALKAELKANPMNEYINAGLLSSIVEDVNIQSGDYTYVSAFKQSVDEKTQWIPKPVKTAAAVLTIAPSTKLYQFLATTTQLSDFVAKYTMSKHLQASGVSVDEAMIEASKTFINYDLPTSQGLQYANDMGLFMFTKYFLRIQAVLFKLLGKKAGSVIAQHVLVESLTGAEGILSPLIFKHIGNNPLESSVFGLPSAFHSIGTVDLVF